MSAIREYVVKKNEKEKGKVNKPEKTEVHSAAPQPASADGEENNEEELDVQYDEFDDEIVVIHFKRQVSFPEWLENYKPEPEKVGVPIEDILKIPRLPYLTGTAKVEGLGDFSSPPPNNFFMQRGILR